MASSSPLPPIGVATDVRAWCPVGPLAGAHHPKFRCPHAPLDALERGQLDALDRLRAALVDPLRVVDAIEPLLRRTIGDGVQLELATGECIAGLNHLMHRAEVVCSDDADGVLRYRLAPISSELTRTP